MRTAVFCMSGIALALCLGACAKAEFKEFRPADGSFKVELPGTPKEKTEHAAGIDIKTYMLEQRGGAYAIGVADLPAPKGEPDEQVQARLEGAKDGVVKNVNGTLKSSTKIALNGKYPGREVLAETASPKGILRSRIYLVDGRLYQVMVIGSEAWANSADATRFLNSFAITKG